MKKFFIGALFLAGSLGSFAQTDSIPAKQKKTTREAKMYTCPMHKDVMRNKPGNCPKCGMKLQVAKTKPAKEKKDTMM